MKDKVYIIPNTFHWQELKYSSSLSVKVFGLDNQNDKIYHKDDNGFLSVDIGAAKAVCLLNNLNFLTSFCCDGIYAHHRYTPAYCIFYGLCLNPYISFWDDKTCQNAKSCFKNAGWEGIKEDKVAIYMFKEPIKDNLHDNEIRLKWKFLNNELKKLKI